jgi:hypothetical protein
MTEEQERQEQKSPELAGEDPAELVGERREQAADARFSRQPEGQVEAQPSESLARELQSEERSSEKADAAKEGLQDTQEEAKVKLGAMQRQLRERAAPIAAVAAVVLALLLLLVRRRRA